MQGSEKVIAALNMTLQEEFTALCQYFIHAEMCPRPWLVVSAGCSPAAIWCNSPPAAGCESPVGAEPFFCLRFPDVLVVILLPLIDLLVVNVSLARSRLIIPSFCRVNQDFHFGFPATIDYTSDRLRESVFPILSPSFPSRATPAAEEGDQLCLARARKTQKCLIPSGFSDTYPFLPSFDLFASPPRRPIRSARAARRSAAACFRTAAASGGVDARSRHTLRPASFSFRFSLASCHTLGIWPGFFGSTVPVPRAACARFIRASSSDNSVSRACWYSSLTTSCGLAELNRYFSVRTSR